jgi:hypothetical protein
VRLFGPIVGLVLASVASPPGDQPLELEACRVQLTELGRRAYFQESIVLRLATGESGVVSSLEYLLEPKVGRRFLTLDDLEACLRRWKLEPSSTYTVVFSAGTTGETLGKWRLSVSSGRGTSLVLALPPCPGA